jgi:uncharacterized damage-inducible protein DinB
MAGARCTGHIEDERLRTEYTPLEPALARAISPVQLIVDAIQPPPRRLSWHGGPTPVGALRNVGVAAARWSPQPGRHSIWALTLHIAYWKYAVRRRIAGGDGPRFPRAPANWPAVPVPADAAAWAADVALLRREHDQLVLAVTRTPASRLGARPPGARKWTYGEIITGIALHDAYHTGQIQLLKRLWQHSRKS